MLGGLYAVHDGHFHIHEHNVKRPLQDAHVSGAYQSNGFTTVGSLPHLGASVLQMVAPQPGVVDTVFCNQYIDPCERKRGDVIGAARAAQAALTVCAWMRLQELAQLVGGGAHHGETERRSRTRRTFNGDSTMHESCQTLRQLKPNAGTQRGVITINPRKSLEQARDLFGSHAGATVLDLCNRPWPLASNGDANAAVISELDGVTDQVQENLPHAQRISNHWYGAARLAIHSECDSLGVSTNRKQLRGLPRGCAEVHVGGMDRQCASLHLRDIKNVIHHAQEMRTVASDRVWGIVRQRIASINALLAQQFGVSNDGCQRGANLMADIRNEVVFCLISTLRQCFALQQLGAFEITDAFGLFAALMPSVQGPSKCGAPNKCERDTQTNGNVNSRLLANQVIRVHINANEALDPTCRIADRGISAEYRAPCVAVNGVGGGD